MARTEEQYASYIESLKQLLALPEERENELIKASRAGVDQLRAAESQERQLRENWDRIERLERELSSKLGRLAQSTGVSLAEQAQPVMHSSSADLLKDMHHMIQEVQTLESSWSWISNMRYQLQTPQTIATSPPQAPLVQQSLQGHEISPTTPKSKSKTGLIAGVTLVAAMVIVGILIFVL